jgi:hypothetical protein
MKGLRDFKEYREERKNIKQALSPDNRNFW